MALDNKERQKYYFGGSGISEKEMLMLMVNYHQDQVNFYLDKLDDLLMKEIEDGTSAQLSPETVLDIRNNVGNHTAKQLAVIYNVNLQTVQKVLKFKKPYEVLTAPVAL